MTIKETTAGIQALADIYELAFDPADKWASNSEWLFAIAEVLTHVGVKVPFQWDFRDSGLHDNWEPEGFIEQMVGDMLADHVCDVDDLLTFGEALRVEADTLIAADLAY